MYFIVCDLSWFPKQRGEISRVNISIPFDKQGSVIYLQKRWFLKVNSWYRDKLELELSSVLLPLCYKPWGLSFTGLLVSYKEMWEAEERTVMKLFTDELERWLTCYWHLEKKTFFENHGEILLPRIIPGFYTNHKFSYYPKVSGRL